MGYCYNIPAGLVDENVLVWFFNAVETWRELVSNTSAQEPHLDRGRPAELLHTEEPAVNRRMAIEDMLKDICPRKREEQCTRCIILVGGGNC